LQAIETYCNALINTNGGMLVFGIEKGDTLSIDHSTHFVVIIGIGNKDIPIYPFLAERVVGFELSRSEEDLFKLSFDGAIKNMRPTIHPHQYRYRKYHSPYRRYQFQRPNNGIDQFSSL
jgi:predicted HTH transcriptional regulator